MRKAQTQILGAVLITAIILLVSGSAFIWGKPLIDKSTDKSKVDGLVLKMAEIDSAIKQAASTGSSKSLKIRINDKDEVSVTSTGEIRIVTYTQVPVISTKDFAPLNSYELSTKKDLVGVETNNTVNAGVYPELVSYRYNSSFPVKNSSVVLEGNYYNLLSYATTASGDYSYACLTNVTSSKPKTSECGLEFQTVTIKGVNYVVQRIDDAGEFVYFTGADVENVGTVTRDVPGVISGKSRVLGTNEGLITTLSLNYRGLQDNNGVIHRIIVKCANKCLSNDAETSIRIYRADVIRTGNSIDTYINVEFD